MTREDVDALIEDLQLSVREWESNKWTAEEWIARFRSILRWHYVFVREVLPIKNPFNQ